MAGSSAVPWKNGGGTTRELVTHPAGAALDDFDWRVSIATIASDGPFSTFPGVDRTITLIAGCGMRLSGADVDLVLDRVGVPFSFTGEAVLDSVLLAGEVKALNVMTRRHRCRAEVLVLDEADDLPASDAGLVINLQGVWWVHLEGAGDGQPVADLAAQEGLWWAGPGAAHRVSPVVGDVPEPGAGGLLAAVRIFRL